MNEKKEEPIADPIFVPVYHFKVAFITNDSSAPIELAFRDVTGLNIELQTEEVRSGGENMMVYRLPKPIKYANLKLSRALSGAEELDEITHWAEQAIYHMKIELKTVQVSLLNEKHEAVRVWSFIGAYPVKLNVSDMNASKNEISIETLELAYKYARRDK